MGGNEDSNGLKRVYTETRYTHRERVHIHSVYAYTHTPRIPSFPHKNREYMLARSLT